MKTRISISIARTNHNEIKLYIKDQQSRICFLEATMTLEDFALAVTGMSEVKASAEIAESENLGKRLIVEKRSVTYLGESRNRGDMEAWVKEKCNEKGWYVNSHLRSQDSIGHGADSLILNYSVYRYEQE